MRSYGATDGQAFRLLRWPSALPSFFTGLRISVVYAVIGAVFGEYVGAREGLGIWMQISPNAFRTDLVFAAIVVTSALSLVALLGGGRAAARGHPVGAGRPAREGGELRAVLSGPRRDRRRRLGASDSGASWTSPGVAAVRCSAPTYMPSRSSRHTTRAPGREP